MAKLKISEMPSESIYDDSIFPMVHDGTNYKVTFNEIKQAILAGINPSTGVGVEYVRTDFTDENNATRVGFDFAYDKFIDTQHQPIIRIGQTAQITNGSSVAAHYELQQNLLVSNALGPEVWENFGSSFKRFEVIYEVTTILFTSANNDEAVVLRNLFTDSFQRTSEAKEFNKQHMIDHQINFVLASNEVARITNQIVIYSIGYDFPDTQVSSRLGTIRVAELSHDSYLNTKIFS